MAATITRGTTYGATETLTNAKLHALVDSATIAGIVNAEIASGAAIVYTKLSLAGAILNSDLAGSIADSKLNQITTASKVHGTSITGLASVPSGAGALPIANVAQDLIVKAWINFDGTGTIDINDSYNVSSIADVGVGNYTINWDTDFANTDYCILNGMTAHASNPTGSGAIYIINTQTPAVGSVLVWVTNQTPAVVDEEGIYIAAIGDQ